MLNHHRSGELTIPTPPGHFLKPDALARVFHPDSYFLFFWVMLTIEYGSQKARNMHQSALSVEAVILHITYKNSSVGLAAITPRFFREARSKLPLAGDCFASSFGVNENLCLKAHGKPRSIS